MAKRARRQSESIEFIARGVVRRGQSLLLCRNLKRGYYYLPGGHVEAGEAAAAALAREFKEETGRNVNVGSPLFTAEVRFNDGRQDRHELNLVFHVEPVGGGGFKSREPSIEFEWVDLAAVVDTDIRPAAIKAWILSGTPTGSIGWASDPL